MLIGQAHRLRKARPVGRLTTANGAAPPEARAKAAAIFCGDSAAFATTLSKRDCGEISATSCTASGRANGLRRATLPSCSKLAAACAQPALHRPSSDASRCRLAGDGAHELARGLARGLTSVCRGSASAMERGASRFCGTAVGGGGERGSHRMEAGHGRSRPQSDRSANNGNRDPAQAGPHRGQSTIRIVTPVIQTHQRHTTKPQSALRHAGSQPSQSQSPGAPRHASRLLPIESKDGQTWLTNPSTDRRLGEGLCQKRLPPKL